MKQINLDFLKKAVEFSKKKHGLMVDDGGKNYFQAHVIPVYFILRQITDDADTLTASLLHDTLEDTNTTYEEIVKEFGKRVADLVMEVTKEGYNYFPRLESKEAILIKFADRLSNLSRMEVWDKDRQEQYLLKSKFWRTENE